ncbi:MAG: hypothetical protein L0Y80_12185 [Ignavibacteriae bacterium]|nr:hypothetical protein [Ignavibacteriota bacterium]
MRRLKIPVLLTVVLCGTTVLRADDPVFSLTLRGSYTTTSKVFFNPNGSTEDLRGQYFSLDGIFGAGLEARYQLPVEGFFVTLSGEYFSKIREQDQILGFAGSGERFPVVDGFDFVPIEFGLHTYIPLGTETARLSMGGGLGVYIGKRVLRVAGVDAVAQNSAVGVGIHISSGFEYRVYPGILLRGEMKFRDPELKTVNKYTKQSADLDGDGSPDLVFPPNEVPGRINIDGFTFSAGVVVELF